MRAPARLAVISWLGGAASTLPFASDWFGLGARATNGALLAAVASTFALGLAIHASERLRRLVARLAGPSEPPRARALVLVAVFAAAGASAMVAATALAGSG